MKSKVKSIKKAEQDISLVFELDEKIIKDIERSFKELKPDFKLSDYRKKDGEKILDNFWQLHKKNGEFNFFLAKKYNVVKLKIKSNKFFIDKFLKSLFKYVRSSELSPKVKAEMERRKLKSHPFKIFKYKRILK